MSSRCTGRSLSQYYSFWQRSENIGLKPAYLQYLRVNTVTNDYCRKSHVPPQNNLVHNTTLCAFARRGQGVCLGDSGGPLASNGQLVGVVSLPRSLQPGIAYLHKIKLKMFGDMIFILSIRFRTSTTHYFETLVTGHMWLVGNRSTSAHALRVKINVRGCYRDPSNTPINP